MPLPVNLIVEYKYTRHDESGSVAWEETINNRKLLTETDVMQVDDGTFGSIPQMRLELPEAKRPIDRRRSVSFKTRLSPRGKRDVVNELSEKVFDDVFLFIITIHENLLNVPIKQHSCFVLTGVFI